jgi:hypothetical protein
MSWRTKLLNDPVGSVLIENQDYSVNFIINPTHWHLAKIEPLMTWSSVKFDPGEKLNVPKEPGLYAFVTRVSHPGLPPHGWVMYIGQTGDGASSKTLRDRFGDYFFDKDHNRRPRIFWFLNLWDGHLDFYFTPLPTRKTELEELETKLLGAFRPPFTDRTYPAKYMSPSHAF